MIPPPAKYVLGKRYHKQGRYADAAEMFAEAEDGLAQKLGPRHPHVIAATVNLAACYWALGESTTSCEHYKRALEALQRTEFEAHPLAEQIRGFVDENCG